MVVVVERQQLAHRESETFRERLVQQSKLQCLWTAQGTTVTNAVGQERWVEGVRHEQTKALVSTQRKN